MLAQLLACARAAFGDFDTSRLPGGAEVFACSMRNATHGGVLVVRESLPAMRILPAMQNLSTQEQLAMSYWFHFPSHRKGSLDFLF